jgi:zinc transport system substrate-binding protein
MNLRLSCATLATALLTSTAMAAPEVVASIKPVHSLVSAIMAGVGEPTLLVRGAASPHTYALKPSDAAALESADLVFWTGHGMELFLADALDTLSTNAEIIELAEAPGIELLPVREGGAFEAHADEAEAEHDHKHEHAEEDHDHDHGEGDMHFWLDPENAKLMVAHIAATLAAADPENAAAYAANAQTEIAKLDALQAELTDTLAPVKDKPFVVFHDAYQYFENRFGLTLAGSITVTPDTTPGAARIDELKSKIAELGATCVFSEPNFQPTIVNAIIEGSPAKAGVIDPEGGALTEGPDLYATLLRGLATSLVDCLG